MAFFRRPSRGRPTRAMTAATAVVELGRESAWATWRFGNFDWQVEAWRLYDVVGELRFLAGWIGDSVSQARLYVTRIDETGEETGEVDDKRIAQMAAVPLGTGSQRDDNLRLLGIDLAIGGEAWIVSEDGATPKPKNWFVVSGSQIRREGGLISVERPIQFGGKILTLRDGNDLLLRSWRPHPNAILQSDSPTRSAIPILREIELLTKREFAELESRLVSAGVWFLPEGIDFPRGEDDPEGIEGFMALMQRLAATNIRDQSQASAMVPIMATIPDSLLEHLDKFKDPTTFWSPVSAEVMDMKERAIRRLGATFEVPSEILTGIGDSNHWCVDDQTEILTAQGWRTHDQINSGDTVLTLNHDTGLSEWQSIGQVKRWDVTDLEMISMEGRGHSSLTTPNHRWPILSGARKAQRARRFTVTENLSANDFLITGALNADIPDVAKYTDAFVEIMGWYTTEGTCHLRPGRSVPRVSIYQSHTANPDNVARIRGALTALYGPETPGHLDKGGRRASDETLERRKRTGELRDAGKSVPEISTLVGVSRVQVAKDLKILDGLLSPTPRKTLPKWNAVTNGNMTVFKLNTVAGKPFTEIAPGRVVPANFVQDLTRGQLELFIDTCIRGDGHYGTTTTFAQKDPAMVEAFELASILSGRSVRSFTRSTMGFTEHVQNGVSVKSQTVWRPNRPSPSRPFDPTSRVSYTGVIWCPTTPNQTWLARRKGTVYYTGNTSWAIGEEGIKRIKPYLATIADTLTRGFLVPALEAEGIEDADRYAYAFDVAPLAVRPNRHQEAIELSDRYLLSDEATVLASAFAPEQMPTEPERLKMLLFRSVAKDPSLLADPVVQAALGMKETISIPASQTPAISGPPPGTDPPEQGTPDTLDDGMPDAGSPGPGTARALAVREPMQDLLDARIQVLVASVEAEATDDTETEDELTPARIVAKALALRGLEVAGGRITNPTDRQRRWADVPRYELHVHVGPLPEAKARKALDGCFAQAPLLLDGTGIAPDTMIETVTGFCSTLLVSGVAYTDRDLFAVVDRMRP